MNTSTVTVTGKNQITLPIGYVRGLKLGQNRRLTAHWQNRELVLKPEPTVEEIMAPVWTEAKKHIKRPLSDKGLKQAIRSAVAYGAMRKEA